jgi:hypothetical protein
VFALRPARLKPGFLKRLLARLYRGITLKS